MDRWLKHWNMNSNSVRILAALILFSAVSGAQTGTEIVQEAQNRTRSTSQRYEGTLKVINPQNKVTEKRWQFERLGSYGESKSVLHFTMPPEVKGVALLVINHKDRSSDQWMWTPAVARERRIALQDRSARLFGTDFSFEDMEERDVSQFDYQLLGEEQFDNVACWKLESKPKQSKISQYTSSLLWIRKDTYTFAKIENFNKSKLIRQIHYTDVEKVQNIWTARKVDVYDTGRNSHTILTLENLQYNIPLKEENFTLQALRRES